MEIQNVQLQHLELLADQEAEDLEQLMTKVLEIQLKVQNLAIAELMVLVMGEVPVMVLKFSSEVVAEEQGQLEPMVILLKQEMAEQEKI